jgi:hypothetical protein
VKLAALARFSIYSHLRFTLEYLILYILILLLTSILIAVFIRPVRLLAVIFISVLIYIPSYFVWFALLYLNIAPVDSLLRQTFGIYSDELVDSLLGNIVFFGPPLLPSVALLLGYVIIRRGVVKKAESPKTPRVAGQ